MEMALGQMCVEPAPHRTDWKSTMRLLFNSILRMATAPWRWLLRRRRLALLLIPFGLAAGQADASDEGVFWTPVLSKQADKTRNDLELTLRARRLLIEDPALARFEIMVRIDDRVAELSGPVPSMEIAQRAESNLKGLMGLAGIRNRLTIADNSKQESQASEHSRVDWRTPEFEPLVCSTALARSPFASRLTEVPAEPTFAWRPVRPYGRTVAFPIPFVPEGLSRPPEVREQMRENTRGSREDLRIGKVELVVSPPEAQQQNSDIFVLPAIDLRHLEGNAVRPTPDAGSTNRLRYLFLGF
jgi:hypothetical protein